jgi:hypothetical protein
MLVGVWENGNIVNGSWELKGAGIYEGSFKLGRPYGAGKFSFTSGLKQNGVFVDKPSTGEEEEQEEGVEKPPNVIWKGDSIVSM